MSDVRPSVLLIKSSNGGRRVCCWATVSVADVGRSMRAPCVKNFVCNVMCRRVAQSRPRCMTETDGYRCLPPRYAVAAAAAAAHNNHDNNWRPVSSELLYTAQTDMPHILPGYPNDISRNMGYFPPPRTSAPHGYHRRRHLSRVLTEKDTLPVTSYHDAKARQNTAHIRVNIQTKMTLTLT